MAVRKLATIHCLEELSLKPQTLKILKEADVTTEELIYAARVYMSWSSKDRLLANYPGIGIVRAREIVQAIDEAGFILHESERSRCARRLLAVASGNSNVLFEHYEDLEDMTPEALEAVNDLIHESLRDQESQVIELRFGLRDGQLRSFEDCARKLGVTRERVRQLEARALLKLRRPSRRSRLEVATCYSCDALARKIIELTSQINKLQAELDLLQNSNPYPDLETVKIAYVSIEELGFSVRTYNCLKRVGINTVGELRNYSENDLLNIRNFNTGSVEEVHERFRDMGLELTS